MRMSSRPARVEAPTTTRHPRGGHRRRRTPSHRLAVFAISLLLVAGDLALFGQRVQAPAKSPSGSELYYGLDYPQAPDLAWLGRYEAEIGKGVSLVLWYQDWQEGGQLQAFPTAKMDATRRHGAIPVLGWYPEDNRAPAGDQPAFSLARIIDGSWDGYLRQYAEAVKTWGHPFFLRFASEMNGSWVPWFAQANGNQPGQFILAWRHVHDVFTSVGAANATWVWCPNVEDSTTTPLEQLYPGAAYVDWLCLDGYNFSVDLGGGPWRSFGRIFKSTYQHVLRLAPPTMPIMIGETGSVEDGGSKAGWITDALTTQLPAHYPRIKALIWFNNTNPGLDLRIETSPQSLAAFRAAVAADTYQPNMYRFLDQSPIPAPEQVVLRPAPVPWRELVGASALALAALLTLMIVAVKLARLRKLA